MLRVYHSNRLEGLLDRLAEVTAEPLPDALAPEWILVQSQGMARWLSLGLAQRAGVAANLRFFMPGAFLWRLLSAQIPGAGEESSFDRETLAWRLMGLLPEWVGRPGFEPLCHYLSGERIELKRWQLAQRIADVFDQYLVYRPEWIRDWEAGRARDDWQAQLWRALVAQKRGPHRVQLLQRFFALCDAGAVDTSRLPHRVCLFGITSMPPSYLALLARVAEYIQVHVFVLNPCLLYWGDIRDERNLARRRRHEARLGRADQSEYFSNGNPLLASFGKQGRDFMDLLNDYSMQEEELFVEPEGESLLARIQRDILFLETPGEKQPVQPDDHSLQVHACHGPLREVEVLHDQLLAMFQRDPTLSPRDVMVMTPDIELYAPHVQAVFGAADHLRHLPWTVADRGRTGVDPVLATVLTLLDLPASRFTANDVIALLDVPAVRRRFDLDEEDLEVVRAWVRDSRIRWGLDERMGLDQNTWDFGFRRLFLGYAMPPDAGLWGGVAPYPHVEGRQAEALGKLCRFVARLDDAAKRLQGRYDAAGWGDVINGLLADFFGAEEDIAAPLQIVRDAIDDLAGQVQRAGYLGEFGLEVLRDILRRHLATADPEQRFLTGQITFCALVPMRSIPFRVVCLLGMSDQAFPRVQRGVSFDRMADEPRPGDRSRRDDDRFLFLEALLSARAVFYVSFVGRSARDNSPLLPSVLVSELLDYIEQGYSARTGAVRAQVVTEHPLQPFSHRYFSGREPRLFSYAEDWLPAARAQTGVRSDDVPFCPAPLADETGDEPIELTDLIVFFRHPARAFLRRRLGVVIDGAQELLEDTEPFALDGRMNYVLGERLLAERIAGNETNNGLAALRAEGVLPAGRFGVLEYERYAAAVDEYSELLHPQLGEALPALEVDVVVDGQRLTGWIDGLRTTGLLRYRYARLSAQDALSLWIEHLVCGLIAAVPVTSRHVARDRTLVFAPVTDGSERLAHLLALYREGLRRPLPLFPRSAFEFAQAIRRGRDPMNAARAAWLQNTFSGREGEGEDGCIHIAFRGSEALGDEFAALAQAVFAPLFDAVQEA